MPIQMFRRSFYPGRGRSNTRSTVVLLAVAAMGYFAGAGNWLSSPNESAAFVRPVWAAEADLGDVLPATAYPATVWSADESRRFDPEWTATPRECDLGKGISTVCLFMD